MRTFVIVFLLFLTVNASLSQGFWTSPVQITLGPYEDTQPTFVNRQGWIYNYSEEWLAFTRFNLINTNICLIKTNLDASVRSDTVLYITDDSAANSHPSLAQAWYDYNYYRTMIV